MTRKTRFRKFSTDKLLELLRETSAKELVSWSERKSYVVTDDTIVKSSERDEIVAYILEVCEREDMMLSTETFSLFANLLDRFLSSYKVKTKYLECLAVACLYIACKVKEEDESISITSEFLAECECKCSINELLRMEQTILVKFEWNINDTTAIDFIYIYHSLLINEFKQVTHSILKEENLHQKEFEFVPDVLDISARIENRLKRCLCLSDLTYRYRPQILAYSLISLEIDNVLETTKNELVRVTLFNTLEKIKNLGKLSYEPIDKCRHEISENIKLNEEEKEFANMWTSWNRLKEYHRPYGMSPLLFNVTNGLDVIEEVDEDEYLERNDQKIDFQKELDGDGHLTCEIGVSTSSSSSSLSCSFTYADVLLGRQIELKKRKREHLSSLNSDEDVESLYETDSLLNI